MASKAKYRIRNWKEYNKSLIQRGSITVWFSEDAIGFVAQFTTDLSGSVVNCATKPQKTVKKNI